MARAANLSHTLPPGRPAVTCGEPTESEVTLQQSSRAPADCSAQDARRRAFWLKTIWATGFLAGFMLSIKLWVSTRTYPLAPVLDVLAPVPYPFDYAWFAVLLALLLAILVWPRPRWALVAFVVLAALLALGDQSRWQPWFYMYLFIGSALTRYPWNNADVEPGRREAVLNACRIVVAGTYFWSGLQKANYSFVFDMFPRLIDPLTPALPQSMRRWLWVGGLAVPVLEAALGLCLLLPRTRKMGIVLAFATHGLILLCIGPWGHKWNSVVWPWNVAMPLLVLALFTRSASVSLRSLVSPRRAIHAAALVLFGIMPGLNFLDLWDSYLSASLYSANTLHGVLHVRPAMQQRLPEALRQRLLPTGEGSYQADLSEWSMDELNVPPYPERRVYRHIARQLLPHVTEPSELILEVWERPHPLTGERAATRYCAAQLQRE
jgi:hypothetical protein